jgi:hypothetical protein
MLNAQPCLSSSAHSTSFSASMLTFLRFSLSFGSIRFSSRRSASVNITLLERTNFLPPMIVGGHADHHAKGLSESPAAPRARRNHEGIAALLNDLRADRSEQATQVAFRRGAFAKGANAGAYRRAGYAGGAGAFAEAALYAVTD